MGFGLVIGFTNHLQVVTTNNYYTIADLYNLQSLHTNLLVPFTQTTITPHQSSRSISTSLHYPFPGKRIYNTGTIKVSLNYTLPI
jgi:hypothetical protein